MKQLHLAGRDYAALVVSALFLAGIIVLPVILVIILSFSSEQSIAENGYRVIPSSFSLDAYRYIAMNIKDLLLSFGVTLFITVTGSALSLSGRFVFLHGGVRAMGQLGLLRLGRTV